MCAIDNSVNAGKPLPQLGKAPIDKIVASMTLLEKVQLLVGGTDETYDGVNKIKIKKEVPGVVGQTLGISRFGIPATLLTDGPAGVRIKPVEVNNHTTYCTGFPIGTLLASTWDTNAVREIGTAIGNEVLEYNCDILLAPGMNIHRNPLCGRNFEYYSEDPYLTGKIAAAMVNGVQSQGVGATLKHFAANNQETLRLHSDSKISQRALREIYLKGFEIAVKESNPWAIMASYNKLNGTFTQQHYPLLTSLLRNEWNFKGIVMTDWTSWNNTRNMLDEVKSGDDLLMPGDVTQIKDILEGVKNGKISIAEIDRNVKHVLEYIIKTPHFRKYVPSENPDLKAHAALTRKIAAEGSILLRNEGDVLPFNKNMKSVALFGAGSYNTIAGGTGSGDVNKPYIISIAQGMENAGYSIDSDIKDIYTKYLDFEKKQYGDKLNRYAVEDPSISKDIIERVAKQADVAVITISRNSGEGKDRHNTPGDFILTSNERNLITDVNETFHSIGKKVIVVLNIGGVIETSSWRGSADAILLTWQGGEECGNSVADVLKGTINPSGKLPMTFPLNYLDIPSSKNFPSDYYRQEGDGNNQTVLNTKNLGYTEYEESIWVGYRYFSTNEKTVSYPFGYGLSYTTFNYSNAKVKKQGNSYIFSVCVKNTGRFNGKEAAELYITAPKSNIEKPVRELKAFAKTNLLAPGESEILTMKISISDLASFDENSNSWITDAGTYTACIGASVQDIRQEVAFNVKNYAQKVATKL